MLRSIDTATISRPVTSQRILRWVSMLAWFVALSPGLSSVSSATETAPVAKPANAYEAVQSSTKYLLARLKEVQPLYESDPETFFAEVEKALDPHLDFEGFAKGVMAKYYRDATPEQVDRFQEKFRHSLIRTYAKALMEFDNQQVIVLDPGPQPADEDKVMVGLEVHGLSGAIYEIQYQMVKVGDGWLLRNVTISGINIGLQFRTQFAALIQRYKKNIDLVIENWSVDV